MLNEFREFYEYIDLSSIETTRLVPGQVLNGLDKYMTENSTERSSGYDHLVGIERPLTIIARRYLFHDEQDINVLKNINEENKKEAIQFAKDKVITWFENDFRNIYIPNALVKKASNYPDFDKNILKSIITNAQNRFDFERSLRREETEDIESGLLIMKEKSIYTNRDAKRVNMWYYDTILADALNDGPLNNIKLLVKNEFVDLIKKSPANKKEIYMPTVIKYVKIIALYYLYGGDENKFPYILFPNIACWFNFINRKNQSKINGLQVIINNEKIHVFEKAPYSIPEDQTVVEKLSDELFEYINKNNSIQFVYDDNAKAIDGYTLIEDNKDTD